MPINYSKYPDNWTEIRNRILKRAKNKCEVCGLENKAVVHSFKRNGITVWELLSYIKWMRLDQPKAVKVVLTIAHLDHDEENHNVTDDRLMAMCQLCHLRYDIEEKIRRRLSKI